MTYNSVRTRPRTHRLRSLPRLLAALLSLSAVLSAGSDNPVGAEEVNISDELAALIAAGKVPDAPFEKRTAPVEVAGDCSEVAATLAALQAAGLATALCAGGGEAREPAAAASVAWWSLPNAPGYCAMGYSYLQDRVQSCVMSSTWLRAIDTRTGAIVGQVDISLATWNRLNPSSLAWRQFVEIHVDSAWGTLAAGVTLHAPVQCDDSPSTDCGLFGGGNWPYQTASMAMSTGAHAYGWMDFDSSANLIGEQNMQVALNWYSPSTVPPTAYSMLRNFWTQRCDRIINYAPYWPGCVYPDWEDNFYTLSQTDPGVQEIARHIHRAQFGAVFGVGYLPDRFGVPGYNNPLRRLMDQSLQNANNRAACGGFLHYPTIPGQQPDTCDEYPFESTYQGAHFVGQGRYSTAHAPADQNSRAGSYLGHFYGRNRIIDGDAFYAFMDN